MNADARDRMLMGVLYVGLALALVILAVAVAQGVILMLKDMTERAC